MVKQAKVLAIIARVYDMDPFGPLAFKSGRIFLCRLPTGSDLLVSISDVCRKNGIRAATFTLTGAVASATLGVYDQQQQVYVTHTEAAPMEILSATGNVSMKKGTLVVCATIALSLQTGKIVGGRLFSPSRMFAVEMTLRELTGHPLKRAYDEGTGLDLWVE